eukprot:1786518-Prymnesium_polylepis.1
MQMPRFAMHANTMYSPLVPCTRSRSRMASNVLKRDDGVPAMSASCSANCSSGRQVASVAEASSTRVVLYVLRMSSSADAARQLGLRRAWASSTIMSGGKLPEASHSLIHFRILSSKKSDVLRKTTLLFAPNFPFLPFSIVHPVSSVKLMVALSSTTVSYRKAHDKISTRSVLPVISSFAARHINSLVLPAPVWSRSANRDSPLEKASSARTTAWSCAPLTAGLSRRDGCSSRVASSSVTFLKLSFCSNDCISGD